MQNYIVVLKLPIIPGKKMPTTPFLLAFCWATISFSLNFGLAEGVSIVKEATLCAASFLRGIETIGL
jgi:hypothetical protein